MAGSADPWALLQECNKALSGRSILDLFRADASRVRRMSAEVGPLYADYSKHLLDQAAIDALVALARDSDLENGVRSLLDGAEVNSTEQRPALHTALRSAVGRGAIADSARREAEDGVQRIRALVERIHAGEFAGVTGKPIDRLISIGIGGSDLGPRLAVDALSDGGGMRVDFLANVDGTAVSRLLADADPERTLFCVISKSFGTRETLLNASTARRWLAARLGVEETVAGRQFVAVTANPERAMRFGIREDAILPMWDWVGGRYSVWSAVGMPLMAGIGPDRFDAFLAGAAAMDEHFASADFEHNLPVMLALIGIWYRNVQGLPAYAVVPYDDRLGRLHEYLQQLDMESNGKRVTRDGRPVPRATGPICWGGIGTNAQHAFFQWLHQSPDVMPLEFVGVRNPDHDHPVHHRELMANMLGQSWALLAGRSHEATAELLASDGRPPELAPHMAFPGNRPSTTFLLERLDPTALGALLALYEHRVFVQGWIWGINSFDQWGVELGKTLANRVLPWLEGGPVDADDVDGSTIDLIRRLQSDSDLT